MSKELKIEGNFGKDFQQIFVGDEPTNIFINNEGKIKSANFDSDLDNAMSIDIDRTNPFSSKLELSDDLCILKSKEAVTLNSRTGRFKMLIGGTEYSPDNSAYAGMILGYTRLQHDGTNFASFEIQNSITVEDDTHKITFKTPPSENVEIKASFLVNRASTDTTITVGLSDADASTGYNSIGQLFEYDNIGLGISDDEVDDEVVTARWVLGASELAAIGSSNTFWIGIGTGGATKTAYLQYGLRATHNICLHPFIIKASALPVTIYDGQ